MLQQILKDMYVDPEILAELGEEQKEMLFYKMRQEQIRRYNSFNKKHQIPSSTNMVGRKTVRILEDRNGDPWTWIFGEGKGEITAEEKWRRTRERKEREVIEAVMREEENQVAKQRNRAAHSNNGNGAKSRLGQTNNTKIKKVQQENKPPAVRPKSPNVLRKFISSPVVRRKDRKVKIETDGSPRSGRRSPIEVHPMIADQMPAEIKVPNRHTTASPATTLSVTMPATIQNVTPTSQKVTPVEEYPKTNPAASEPRHEEEDLYEDLGSMTTNEPEIVSNDEWKKQLRRFKEEDAKRSLRARSASKEYKRQSILASDPHKLLEIRRLSQYEQIVPKNSKPPLPPKPKKVPDKKPATAPKPKNRQEIVDWFASSQEGAWHGDVTPSWFHGIINRQEAEQLLLDCPIGDYLVRVSDKIWGYALSYRESNRAKHFLIDASKPQCFHFFGIDQIRHETLNELLNYHQVEPITYNGEILKNPVGQKDPSKPDYNDLCITKL